MYVCVLKDISKTYIWFVFDNKINVCCNILDNLIIIRLTKINLIHIACFEFHFQFTCRLRDDFHLRRELACITNDA